MIICVVGSVRPRVQMGEAVSEHLELDFCDGNAGNFKTHDMMPLDWYVFSLLINGESCAS